MVLSSFLTGEELGKQKGLKILCHNSRSVFGKLWQYDLLFKNIDYLCISESWLHPGIPDHSLHMNNMTVFRQDRDHTIHDVDEEEGGGVACFVTNKYAPYTQRLDDFCKVTKNIEVLTLATVPPEQKHRLIITVYRPPKGNVKEFYSEISKIITDSGMADKEIWVCGDMNVDYKHRNSHKYKKALKFLKKNHLKHLPTGSTRLHPRGSTTIDHIYTNKGQFVASGNVNEYLSDHIPIYAIFKKVRNNLQKKKITGRSYKYYNKDNLIAHMSAVVTEDNIREMDADGLAILLIESLNTYLDKTCPVRDFTIPEEDRPWVDDNILQMIKDRRKALKLASSFDGNGPNLHLNEARRLRQAIDKKGRNNMAKIIKDKLHLYRKNPKKFWEELNKIWKGGKKTSTLSLIDDDTGTLIEPQDTASYVNEFFCNIGSNLALPLMAEPGNYERGEALHQMDNDGGNENPVEYAAENNLLMFDEIGSQTLKYTVDDIETKKSSGLEDIRAHVVKDSMLGNLAIWTAFVNLCIRTSTFPDILKIGVIIPLPKCGNLRSIYNWRPITLLPVIGKVLEKVMHRQLMNFVEEYNIMHPNQYGFLPNRSTAMAALHLVNILYSARNKGEFVMAAFPRRP